MLAATAAVVVPPASSYCSPLKPASYSRWRVSWSYRAAKVEAGYSQLEVRKVTYRPPGTEHNLLNEINLSSGEKLLAGLSEPTSGSIYTQKYDDCGNPIGFSEMLTSQRGTVFQFPERYFLTDTVLEEVTFGWPRQKAGLVFKEQLAQNLQKAFNSVQTPDLLLLDEPLAGLDWKARAGVVNLLKDLKKHHTILVVSHDLRKLYPLVDRSWRMRMGGSLKEESLPM